MTRLISSVLILGVALCAVAVATQAAGDRRLASYLSTEKRVSELEWGLLQVNLRWIDSFGNGEYTKTRVPVLFDKSAMKFIVSVRVAEKRLFDDPSPFSSLSEARKRDVLFGPIDHVRMLLSDEFEGLRNIEDHLEVRFFSDRSGGGFVRVATYASGRLTMDASR